MGKKIFIGSIIIVSAVAVTSFVVVQKNDSSKDEVLADKHAFAQGRLPEDVFVSDDFEENDENKTFAVRIEKDGLLIEAPVVEGVRLSELSEGIGHHVTTAFPNEDRGNVVLSGHQWYPGDSPYNTVFENLDQLTKGDRIYVTYDEKEFIYEVFAQQTINDDVVDILEDSEEPQLTLYTCTPRYTSQQRLVYTAKLVETRIL